MNSRKNMCPNEACEHHGKVTSLMGGCECGASLVAYRSPEDRQWDSLSPAQRRLVGYMMLADLQRRL